jgi:hypothetical protein
MLAFVHWLFALALVAAPGRATMTYDQAVDAFRTIKKGTPRAQVIALLGEPSRHQDRFWVWDFTTLKDYPGIEPGRQTFTGGVITFDDRDRVERAELAWIDATGPPPPKHK